MLISKGIASGETVSVKLISGEELIAKLDEDNSEVVKLNRPKLVSIGPKGLAMMPFIFLGNVETVTIKQSHVITMVPAAKDAADQYLEGTTGIALA